MTTRSRKILFVCNTDFFLNAFLRPLVLALADRGYEVHTASSPSPPFRPIGDKRIVHHPIDFPSSASPPLFLRSISRLVGIIRKHKFDCVNSHTRNASICARIAAWWCDVPFNIYTANGFYFHDNQAPIARRATIQLERVLSRITTYTLSQSQEDIDLMVSRGYVDAARIAWIGNGVDNKRFTPASNRAMTRKQLGLPEDAYLIVGVGRLVEGKGFQDLIQAFVVLAKRHASFHLMIVGGEIAQDIDPVSSQIEQIIEKNGLAEKVTLTGMVRNVEDYLAASDVYVTPSYREGISNSMLEAMSCDLPVVASRIRGAREIIMDKVTGRLFDPHDVEQLTNRIEWCYNNQSECAKYARRSRQLILDTYNQRQYVARQIEAMERLFNDGR